MVKPKLVDYNFYHKVRNRFIRQNNNILSYRFNLGIVLFMLISVIFIYFIYLDKKKDN